MELYLHEWAFERLLSVVFYTRTTSFKIINLSPGFVRHKCIVGKCIRTAVHRQSYCSPLLRRRPTHPVSGLERAPSRPSWLDAAWQCTALPTANSTATAASKRKWLPTPASAVVRQPHSPSPCRPCTSRRLRRPSRHPSVRVQWTRRWPRSGMPSSVLLSSPMIRCSKPTLPYWPSSRGSPSSRAFTCGGPTRSR